jgi:hypothetical protein
MDRPRVSEHEAKHIAIAVYERVQIIEMVVSHDVMLPPARIYYAIDGASDEEKRDHYRRRIVISMASFVNEDDRDTSQDYDTDKDGIKCILKKHFPERNLSIEQACKERALKLINDPSMKGVVSCLAKILLQKAFRHGLTDMTISGAALQDIVEKLLVDHGLGGRPI